MRNKDIIQNHLSDVIIKYYNEYNEILGTEDEVLVRSTINLFRTLTFLAIDHRELDKGSLSNHEFKVVSFLMAKGHLKLEPSVVVDKYLWNFMNSVLYDTYISPQAREYMKSLYSRDN